MLVDDIVFEDLGILGVGRRYFSFFIRFFESFFLEFSFFLVGFIWMGFGGGILFLRRCLFLGSVAWVLSFV